MGKNDYVGDDGVSCSGETLGKNLGIVQRNLKVVAWS